MEGDDRGQAFEDDELSSPLDGGPRLDGSDDPVVRYSNGEPVSKRTLQNRKAQREFRQRRANYLKELEEKVRRYESGQTESTQALQREIIQLREENDYLRNQLARFHADSSLMPMAPPLAPSTPRMSFSAPQPPRTLPAQPTYNAAQYQAYYALPHAATGPLPMMPQHEVRPRSPVDHRARSPFGHEAMAASSPGIRGRQTSAPNMLGGPPEGWAPDPAPLRPPHPAESMPPLPPLSMGSLRSSTGSPAPTSPQWYPGPPSAGMVPPKSWLASQHSPTTPTFGNHPSIHSPTSLHHHIGPPHPGPQ